MQCLINKGFCLHLLINFLSHLRHFTLSSIPIKKEYIESVKKHEKAEINITYIALSILNKVIFPIYLKSKCCTLCNA